MKWFWKINKNVLNDKNKNTELHLLENKGLDGLGSFHHKSELIIL